MVKVSAHLFYKNSMGMPSLTDKKTDEVKIVYDSEEEEDEILNTTFTVWDVLRMIAGVVLLWSMLSKVFSGHWFYLPLQGHVSRAPKAPPRVSAYWEGQKLPLPFTLDQLSHYTGTNDESLPILLSVKGHVFDVSESESFYGKWGAYRKFAGTDCSNLLSYSIWDVSALGKKCSHKLTGLSIKEMERIDSWLVYFNKKYPEVGYLIKE